MYKKRASIYFLSNEIYLVHMRNVTRSQACGYLHSYIMLHELGMLKWQLHK